MVGTTSEELTKNSLEHLILIQDKTSEMLSGVTLSTFNIFSRGVFKADECKDNFSDRYLAS